ncbi:DUF445 family protein [Desulfogranum mediterraneum]|uniref:DUF445 family protein n=1 Tax=Desulfogranum mediterraneum TaxID=160661 RepID=UPI000401C449|nr:DUF445 family protein [Desulfogranum mediterraneum]
MQSADLIVIAGYAGPPLIGAFIGYLTNRVAIRMLFRPLKAWHLFGMRLPMTPGVIPAKRHLLAVNIGEMVGEHLLTSTEIGTALSREPFQNHLHSLVDQRLQGVLRKELGPVSSFVPERFQAYFKVAVTTLKYRLGVGISSFMAGEQWEQEIRGFLEARLAAAAGLQVNDLLAPESRTTLYRYFNRIIHHILVQPETAVQLAAMIRAWLVSSACQGKSLEQLLPRQTMEMVQGLIGEHTPALMRQFGYQLAEPTIRAKIIRGILSGVDHFIDSLGPVGAMARGFIDMDSLESTVESYLGEKEEDIIAWLQEPAMATQVAGVLSAQVQQLMETPLADLLARAGDEQVEELASLLAEQLLTMVRGDGPGETGSILLEESIESWLDQGEITLDTLLARLQDQEDPAAFTETLVSEALRFFRPEGLERLLHILVGRATDMLLERPVGCLHAVIPQGVQQGITDYVVLTTNKMLLKEVPGLVGSLHINELVTQKVDSLDLLKLEQLLLSIMEEQFKYINLFGALLGFVIGCLNLVIMRLL